MAETTGSATPAKAGGVAPGPQSGTGCGFAGIDFLVAFVQQTG